MQRLPIPPHLLLAINSQLRTIRCFTTLRRYADGGIRTRERDLFTQLYPPSFRLHIFTGPGEVRGVLSFLPSTARPEGRAIKGGGNR